MAKTDLERQYTWARFVISHDSNVPHRVPFQLARRFNQIATLPLALPCAADLSPASLPACAGPADHPDGSAHHDARQVGHRVPDVAGAVRQDSVLQQLAHRRVERKGNQQVCRAHAGEQAHQRGGGEEGDVHDLVGPGHRSLHRHPRPVQRSEVYRPMRRSYAPDLQIDV